MILVTIEDPETRVMVYHIFVTTEEEANAILADPQWDGYIKGLTYIDDMEVFLKSLKRDLRAKAELKMRIDIEEKYSAFEISILTALQAEKASKYANMVAYILPFYETMTETKQLINACTTYEDLIAIVI